MELLTGALSLPKLIYFLFKLDNYIRGDCIYLFSQKAMRVCQSLKRNVKINQDFLEIFSFLVVLQNSSLKSILC